jgi:hypothetical protein
MYKNACVGKILVKTVKSSLFFKLPFKITCNCSDDYGISDYGYAYAIYVPIFYTHKTTNILYKVFFVPN